MKKTFTKYRIELVRESVESYDVERMIKNPNDIYTISKKVLKLEKECEEVCCLLALDTKNKIIGVFELSRGTLTECNIHPREVFKRLSLCNACRYAMIHNHPSGDTKPSLEDIRLCEHMNSCSHMIGIELLDFCIIGDDFYSFKENGLLI